MAGTVLWLHALVLLLLVLATRKDVQRFPRVMLLAELLYGFVNPLVYLVILQHAAVAPRYALLTGLAWVLFLAVWGSRLWGGLARFRESAVTRWCVCGPQVLVTIRRLLRRRARSRLDAMDDGTVCMAVAAGEE